MIRHYSGTSGSPTLTDVAWLNTRHNTSDTHAASGTATPVPVPTSGTNYGYWVALRADCTVTPAVSVGTMTFYADGASGLPTGITAKVATASSYVQATGTSGTTGLQLNTTNYPTLAAPPVDLFTYTAGSPLAVTGSIANPSTGPFGDWVVLQVEVASTAAGPGEIPFETWNWAWVET